MKKGKQTQVVLLCALLVAFHVPRPVLADNEKIASGLAANIGWRTETCR